MNFTPAFQAYPVAINVEIKQETLPPQNIFNCAFCNETFRSRKALKEHKQSEHNQLVNKRQKSETQVGFYGNYVPHQPKFQCEYCFKGFDQSHRLKQHQISHREPIFHCDQVCYSTPSQTSKRFSFSSSSATRSSSVSIA